MICSFIQFRFPYHEKWNESTNKCVQYNSGFVSAFVFQKFIHFSLVIYQWELLLSLDVHFFLVGIYLYLYTRPHALHVQLYFYQQISLMNDWWYGKKWKEINSYLNKILIIDIVYFLVKACTSCFYILNSKNQRWICCFQIFYCKDVD